MNTLVVYNECPEAVRFFVIPNDKLTPEHIEFLEQAQGKMINADEMNPGMEFIMSAVSKNPEHCDPSLPEAHRCVFHPYSQDSSKPITAPITRVYYTGFAL